MLKRTLLHALAAGAINKDFNNVGLRKERNNIIGIIAVALSNDESKKIGVNNNRDFVEKRILSSTFIANKE